MVISSPLDPQINSPTGFTNSCVIWLDASDTTTLSTFSAANIVGNRRVNTLLTEDRVGFWGNKAFASSTFHQSLSFTNNQGLTANRPFYIPSLSAIDFRSLDQTYLSTSYEASVNAAAATAGSQTVLIFTMPRDGVEGYRIFTQNAIGSDDSTSGVIPSVQVGYTGAFATFRTGVNYISQVNLPRSKGKFNLIYYNSNGTTIQNGLNLNTASSTTNAVGSLTVGRMRLGARLNATGTINSGSQSESNYDGLVREVIVYNRSLTTTEITSIFRYLTGKWDLEVHQQNNVYALSSGDWYSILWSTSALPVPGKDTVYSNGFNVYINSPLSANIITNRFGAGSFILGNGVSLSANLIMGSGGQDIVCMQYTGTDRQLGSSIFADLCARTAPQALSVNSTGFLNVRGNILGAERLFISARNIFTNNGNSYLSGSNHNSGNIFQAHGIQNNNVISIVGNVIARGFNAFGLSNSSVAYLTGDALGDPNFNGNAFGVTNNQSAILVMRGYCNNSSINRDVGLRNFGFAYISGGSFGNASSAGINNLGFVALTGIVVGGSGGNSFGIHNEFFNNLWGSSIITGNVFGGSGGIGIRHNSSNLGFTIIDGDCVGGTGTNIYGAIMEGLGSIDVKRAVGNSFGRITISGVTGPSAGVHAANPFGLVTVQSLQVGPQGIWPTSGNIFLNHVENSQLSARAEYSYPSSAAFDSKTTSASGMVFLTTKFGGTSFVPAVSNVRLGIVYDLLSKTGTCILPVKEVVLKTEALDDGFGAATFDTELIWTVPIDVIRGLPTNSIGQRMLNIVNIEKSGEIIRKLR